jgi:ParB family chromosome partitioning protein
MKSQRIERIPISEIRVVNPRARNPIAFRSIINNIKAVGLKKPITVARCKPTEKGIRYELVCGQGRLEAVAATGGKNIPALITDAPRRERFLMSLIENIARKRPRGSELFREVKRLKKLRYRNSAIGEIFGLGHTYVEGIVRLAKCGEERLVEAVEAGTIPLSIAVKIATSGGKEIQRTLNDAYKNGEIRGAKLRAVERLLATRSRESKPAGKAAAKALSGAELLKEYESFTDQQRALVKRASLVHERLAILTASMNQLLADSEFLRLLRAEGLDSMPEPLISRLEKSKEVRL